MFKKIFITLFAVSFLWAGIWIYLNPVPVSWCPEYSYLTNFINVYTARFQNHKVKLPWAYFWNFSCPVNEPFYNGRTNKNIYSSDIGVIEWVDITSFKVLDNFYAKDKNRVYYWWAPLSSADVESFEVIILQNNGVKDQKSIAKDKNSVYMDNRAYRADVKSFTLVSSFPSLRYYFKDINNVYWSAGYYLITLKWANPTTFEVLWTFISRDDKNIYITADIPFSIIPGIDIATFKYIWWLVTADKNHVYYKNTIIENLSPRNLIELWEGFYKKKTKIYGAWIWIIEGIDMETFECLPSVVKDRKECGDKNYKYYLDGGGFSKIIKKK